MPPRVSRSLSLAVVSQFKPGDAIKIRLEPFGSWSNGVVDSLDYDYEQIFVKDSIGAEIQYSFSEYPKLFMKER